MAKKSRSEKGGEPMSLQPHQFITAVRIEVDEESGEPVNIVTTALNINPESRAFNKSAFDELVKHCENWQRANFEMVTIEGSTDP